MLLVRHAPAQIGLRVASFRRRVSGRANHVRAWLLAGEQPLGIVDAHGAWPRRRERDARSPDRAVRLQRYLDRGRGGRVVAHLAFDFLIRAGRALVRNRELHLERDLAFADRSREAVDEELVNRYRASAGLAADDERGTGGECDGGPIAGRIVVTQTADDRGGLPDDGIRDDARGVVHEGPSALVDPRRALDGGVARDGANVQRAVVEFEVVELF